MLHEYQDVCSVHTFRGSALVPEQLNSDVRVLLINTRSYQSDLLNSEQQAHVDPNSFFVDMLAKNDDLHKGRVPSFDVAQLPNLQLSSDQTSVDWATLARLIEVNYHKYVGFVVQNGTDNMVTTATALSFMLENLGKPVIFTGSLIPGGCIYTDMKRNIILSLFFACCGQLCEVCLLFDERLFRANRTIKISRSNLSPFDSPHLQPLATVHGGVLRMHRPLLRPHPHGKFRVMESMNTKVFTLQLGPGVAQEALLMAVQATNAKAILLNCYGSGNGPARGDYMKNVLSLARSRGILVVICTQNRYGVVNLSEYEAGRQLLECGALTAADMTHEAALMKLKYLFGAGFDLNGVRDHFLRDLRGEVSRCFAHL